MTSIFILGGVVTSFSIRLPASCLALSVAKLLPRRLVHHHGLDVFVVFVVCDAVVVAVFAVVVVVAFEHCCRYSCGLPSVRRQALGSIIP